MGALQSSSKPPLQTVESIDLPRYMGTWYVIAVIPTFAEKNARDCIEQYDWNETKKRVDIKFTKSTVGQAASTVSYNMQGRPSKTSNSVWSVSMPWIPFVNLAYLLIDIPKEELSSSGNTSSDPYSHCVIGYSTRAYAWIMAREKTMAPELYSRIKQELKEKHLYDNVGDLVIIEHDGVPAVVEKQ